MWKLLSDYDIKLKNFVELSDMANDKLTCVEKWSLDGLVKHLFKKQLFKDKDVRCSHWDKFQLTEEQKRYAATDAYAGLIVHQTLEKVMSSGVLKAADCLKNKLSGMCRELGDLAACVPDGLDCTSSIARLLEDMSQHVASLKQLLMNSTDTDEVATLENSPKVMEDQIDEPQHAEISIKDNQGSCQRSKDRDGSLSNELALEEGEESDVLAVPRGGFMSLDVSEYELQMMEMQAKQEETEEQSLLAFEEKAALESSADLSYEAESDGELDNEMIQCVEEMEKLNESSKKQSHEPQTVVEDEEDDVEEDEEERFDPNLAQPAPELIKCLKTYFGHHNFKPVQWKVIQSVIDQRRDNLVVMATGYGKSLCFQFPPVFCMKISVVISPLIALMEDQVLQLQMSNIPACFVGSAQTQNVFSDLKKGLFRVVYMTPEFCSGSLSLLQQLNMSIGISLIAVDEAHCISQWGHDFRSAYRDLGKLKRSLPGVPIVALTATASPSIREDIVKSLHLMNPLITCTSFDRPNLYLDVKRKSGDIVQDLKSLLVKKAGGDYEFEGATIVYCPSKKEAERVTSILNQLGIRCGVYHAGLGIKKRKETQYRFMRDEIQCVVATVAFGMGINKPDIRKVIHYGAPKEMESYYQEIGRAGRDGLPSACHVLWVPRDMALNRFLLNQTNSDRIRGYKMEMMAKMGKYLNSTKCRRKLILSHFEDKQLRKVTSGIMGTVKCCDNCKSGILFSSCKNTSEQDLQDFGLRAFQLMGAVSAMGEKFGITPPILMLRGSTSQRVPDRFRHHALFGEGKSVSEAWWRALSRELIAEKYLMETSGFNKFSTLCKLAPKGKMWLSKAEDEKHRTLLLQPNQDLCPRVYVPRRAQDARPSVAGVQGDAPPDMRKNIFFQLRTNEAVKNPEATQSRFVSEPRPSPKPQPPAVSAREIELQAELYGKLVSERQKLASMKDIPPAILATNKILLDMAKLRPCTVAKLKQVDGVSEAKAAMLAPLLQTINEFCQTHNLQSAVDSGAPSTAAPCPLPSRGSQAGAASFMPLTDSVSMSYRLFQNEGKSVRQVADTRSLPVAVVESHLLQAQKANCPLDTERAGLSSSVFSSITCIVSTPPINSDLSDFQHIRALVPEEISTFLLKLCISKLQREGVPKTLPVSSTSQQQQQPQQQQQVSWIEMQKRPDEADAVGTSLRSGSQPPEPELDTMDISEDDLYSEVLMPEEACQSSSNAQSNLEPAAPTKTAGGMELASWNQERLDQDTRDLFSDSPVKTVNQLPKRKLPDWAETREGSSAAAAAAPKKTKKKKGLFM